MIMLGTVQSVDDLQEILSLPAEDVNVRISKLDQLIATGSEDTVLLARSTYQLGLEYMELGFTDKALENFAHSLEFFKSRYDSSGVSEVLLSTSRAYSKVQEFNQALKSLHQACIYTDDLAQTKEINTSIGYVYFNLYQLDSAEKYLKKAAVQFEEIGELPIRPLLNLSGVNVMRKHYSEALQGLLHLEDMGLEKLPLASRYYVLSFIAALYHQNGNERLSKKYLQRRDSLHRSAEKEPSSLDFYETMAIADTLLGDYAGAVSYNQKYIDLFKELNKNNLATQLANFQKLYELKEKEAEISLLEKENQLISLRQQKSRFYLVIAILGIVVLLLAIILIYRSLLIRTLLNRKLTKLNDQISQQKDDLHQQNQLLEQTIANLQQTQAKLIRSEKMASIGVFVSGVAHELNNPINVVSGGLYIIERNLSELLKGDIDIDAQSVADVDVMLKESGKSIEKINRIIQALTMATYTDQIPVEVDISQIIDNVLIGLDLYDHRKIDFTRDTPAATLTCFPNRIHHALKSILENALFFAEQTTSDKPSVMIKTRNEDENIVLEVSNNGPGIPEDQLLKIFDPFFTTKEDELSPGLGLYFAFSAISEHNGTIEARNDHGWVRFEVVLPCEVS